MSPADLSPEGQARFARLSKRWAEESAPPRRAVPRITIIAKLIALTTTIGALLRGAEGMLHHV